MRILAGLGNPGAKYQETRHNAGWWLLEALGATSDWHTVQGCEVARHGEHLLVKPGGYMNEAGKSLAALARFYKVAASDVLIVCDDVYQPAGTARLRTGGGDGGHNGLKSVIQNLGPGFQVCKIGVGPFPQDPADRERHAPLDDFVLTKLPRGEHEKVVKLRGQLQPLLLGWLENGTWEAQTVHLKQ